jgi:hypothetical protein
VTPPVLDDAHHRQPDEQDDRADQAHERLDSDDRPRLAEPGDEDGDDPISGVFALLLALDTSLGSLLDWLANPIL